MQHQQKQDWLARLTMLGLLGTGIAQAAWILVDDFSSGLGSWTTSVNNATIGVVTNTLTGSSGPSGSVVKLDMPASAAINNKYALMTLNSTLSRGTSNTLEVAFDVGYTRVSDAGYSHAISLQTSPTSTTGSFVAAGHQGQRANDPYKYAFWTATGTPPAATIQTFSSTSQTQLTGTWYHYDLKMTATQSVLNVYAWVSSDPAAYAALTPYATLTTSGGIGTGNYYLRIYNTQRFASIPDTTSNNSRDIMYADNIYYFVPEPTALALLGLGALGLAGRRRRNRQRPLFCSRHLD